MARSNSKMRMIRQGIGELSKKMSFFPMLFYGNIDLAQFSKNFFSQNQTKVQLLYPIRWRISRTTIMVYKTLRSKKTKSPIAKILKRKVYPLSD